MWVPAVYSSPGIYLVKHPVALGWYGASAILFLGVLSIWTNYDADRQRHNFRQVCCFYRQLLPVTVAGNW